MKTNIYKTTTCQRLFCCDVSNYGNPRHQRRRTKRWNTAPLLMVMLALLWIMPQNAQAAIGGNGIASDPFTINSLADLNQFRTYVNTGHPVYIGSTKYWKLTTNIDASGSDWGVIGININLFKYWFTGYFDGGGYEIKIGSISNNTSNYIGFFSVVSNATIKNLTVNLAYFDCQDYVGGLVGEVKGTTYIENCHVIYRNTSYGYGKGWGGIVGQVWETTLNMTGCSAAGFNYYAYINREVAAGGLIGIISSSTVNIIDCMAQGNLYVSSSGGSSTYGMGGLVGVVANASKLNMTRVVQIGTVDGSVDYASSRGRAVAAGHIGEGSSVTIKGIRRNISEQNLVGKDNGSRSWVGSSAITDWNSTAPYSLDRRTNEGNTDYATNTRGNERWGYYDNSRPRVTTGTYAGTYAVKVTRGSNIRSISGHRYASGNDYYINADQKLTVTSTFSPGPHQRVAYAFPGDYSPSSGSRYSASMSGNNWLLTPKVNGTVSASLINIPYPYDVTTSFDQWTSKITLNGKYNNPDNLSGTLYFYKREGGSGGWAREATSITVSSGSTNTFTKVINLTTDNFEKSWEYYIVFIEGSGSVPNDPTNSTYVHKALVNQSTITSIDLSDYIVTSRTNDAELKFRVDNRLINSPNFTYAIQSRVKGSSNDFENWKEEQRFDGRNGYYTETDNRMASACDIYEYRLVVKAFNKIFTSDVKEGSKTSATKFDNTQPFKASKGEYANYVRLQWKVAKDDGGSAETFRVFRRVANSGDAYTELETVTSTSSSIYWSDNNALTGVFYEYMVKLYQICGGVEMATSEEPKDIGFTQAFGTVSGRVTYGMGTSVPDVQMLVRRNELQEGEQQYRSLKSTGGGQSFEWKADNTYFNTLWTSKKWTLQFWLRPEGTSTPDNAIIGYIGGTPINVNLINEGYQIHWLDVSLISEIIPANRFTHISISRDNDSIRIYTVCDQNPDSIYIANKAFYYTTANTLSAENSKISFGHAFAGNIDDLRLWKRVLSETEIKRDYNRYIIGNESGLIGYWTLDEGLAGYAFDRSRAGTVYNGNHATTNSLASDTSIPDEKSQLALKGISDANGNYQISGIPYSGEGTSYSIIPSLGVHKFNPTEQLRYISPTSMVHNATDFTDISSFEISGTILYEGGTYPVEDCSFEIDDQPVTLANGTLYTSGRDGDFTINVPIGVHKVRVVKQGHSFANQGLLQDNGVDINYNKPLSGIKFFDQTKVKLIGRIVGGLAENDKPLGFGESKNNIGARKITLESTRKAYKFVTTEQHDTVLHNNGEWKKAGGLFQDTTRVTFDETTIDINLSSTTGEFVAWVYPEPYNILDIKVVGDNNTQVTIYNNNEMIDLSSAAVPDNSYMKTSVRTWEDSVFVSKPGMVDHYEQVEKSDTVRYHADWKYYYQSTPTFSVLQLENKQTVDYLGDKSTVIKDELTGESDTIALWDSNNYLFAAPLFKQGNEYQLKLQAYEQYVNYTLTPADTTTYPVTGGVVNITNNIRVNPQPEQVGLDSLGTAIYSFMAGAPDLTTAKNSIFATVQIGGFSYYWDRGATPVEAWHLGDRSTGTDFMTSGPDELSAILRDPPGSNSYAYIEKGTTITTSVKNSIVDGMAQAMNLTTSLGPKITTFIGLGAGIITETETKIDISGGIKSEQTWNRETESSTSTTFTERFETSSDPLYVGHLGDVFIGNSTNIQYGLTNSIQIQKGDIINPDAYTEASINSKKYQIVPAVGLAYGQTFATRFAFTQVQLEEVMIPKWQQSIEILLKPVGTVPDVNVITEPVYVSKLDKTDDNFGKINIDTDAFPDADMTKPYDGESYKVYFPVSWTIGETGKQKMTEFQDSIIWANNQINTWVSVLEQNEREKVEMVHKGNYSFDAGASIEQSTVTTMSNSTSKAFTWVLNPSIGGETGGEVMGIGLNLKVELEYKHESVKTETGTEESTMTVGFVLAEEGDDDQITVDYGTTASGTIAFKSRGGRTSCPYEGEVKSKYFEPGRHILSEGTMQIEVPKIDVAGASSVLNVPANKMASFVLDLKNESETEEDVWFQLIVDEATNPDGAELKIDGGIIGNGRMFLVKAGEVLKKTLTVGKGTADTYNNIGLILRSQCQHDPTDFLPDIADTTFVSVEFVPGCSDVQIKEPSNNWIVNSHHATCDTLYVTIDSYDVNYPNFGYIRLQQRLASSPSWSTVTTFYPSHLYANAQGVKEDIGTRSALVYPWRMPSIDGAYELRATAYSVNSSEGTIVGNPLSSYSTAALSGYKDVSKPTSLGAPSPASGILSAADELSITFNEDIQTGMLTKNNFSISGVLNEQEFAEPNVGLAFDGSGSAQTELPIYTNASFSIETWFSRKPNTAGTLFAYGANDNYLSLGFDASGKAVVKAGGQSFTSVDAIANDETWKYIALVYNRTDNTVAVHEFEGASSKTLFTSITLTGSLEMQGKLYVGGEATRTNGFQGAIAQLHFYGDARKQADVSADKSLTKTGKDRGLIGYWNLDEGEGAVAKDKARQRNLILNTGWYIYPSGKAIALNGSNYVSIPVLTYPLNVYSNVTLEFWFKGGDSQAEKILFSSNEASIGFDTNQALVLYKSDGSINQILTTTNLLDNEWHHLALSVKRNGSAKAYIDGVNTATFSSDVIGSLASANYYFGAKYANPNTYSAYFTGGVDEIRIWNGALTRDLILLNKNTKLKGDEAGLIAYYPFEKYVKQISGLINVTATMENSCDDFSAAGTATTSDVAVAVKDVRPVEDVPFTYVASNDKIVFTLDSDYFSRVEGVTLNISAKDIYDMRNNRSNAETWTAYVNRNPLMWDSEDIKLSMEEGSVQTFTAKIANKSGVSVSYAINNLPDWLSVNSSVGNLSALSSKELTFTIFKGINIGNYESSIELTSGNGVNEILAIQLKVTGQRPDWSVNPFDYESNMNITGRIQIMGIEQEDEDDLLAAFIEDECVGLCSPIYVPEYNSYFTFMTVYGNSEHAGKALRLKLWDASTGNVYPVVESSLNGSTENLIFHANAIKGDGNIPVIHNARDIVQQTIELASGWNWVAFNIENSEPALLKQVTENVGNKGKLLKSQNEGYVQAPSWVGELTSLNAKTMYMLQTNAAHRLEVSGEAIKPANLPITLVANGWTWIGYTPQFTLPVSSALAGVNPQVGDQIKGHTAYRTYMGSTGWLGSLDYMRPGEGFMYYSKNSSPQTFNYPSVASQYYKVKRQETPEAEKFWSTNVHKYANNMTITGYVEIDGEPVHNNQLEIAAFVGDECRGSIMLTNYGEQADLPQPYMVFLVVYGDENEELHFKAYSHEDAKEYLVLNDPIMYATNKVLGDPIEPFKFVLEKESGLSNLKDIFNIYPNPVNDVLYINHQFGQIDELEVTDISGRTVIRKIDFTQNKINVASYPEGLYILKMTVNNQRQVYKFMKQ